MIRALSLRASVVVLAAACVLAAQAVSFAILLAFPGEPPPPLTAGAAAAAVLNPATAAAEGLTRRVSAAPPFEQDTKGYTRLVSRTLRGLLDEAAVGEVRVRSLSDAVSLHTEGAPPPALFAPAGWSGDSRRLAEAPFPSFAVAARRVDGRWVVVAPRRPPISPEHLRIAAAFGLSAVLLTPLTWWSARRLTRPLQLLVGASQALGRDPGAPPLCVDGPREVREAATAFNAMQADLARHIDERATLMAALAHDLRTPLTSLRLRAESAPEPDRSRMAADIARMDALTADLLLFARGGRATALRERIDLRELARVVAEAAAAQVAPASSQAEVIADPAALRRALENLVSNAVAYAGGAELTVGRDDGVAWVEVADEGLGVPEEALEAVFSPFVRLETSRSLATGGVGLGLAIARSIARAHGGDVELRPRQPSGLVARLWLPRPTPSF